MNIKLFKGIHSTMTQRANSKTKNCLLPRAKGTGVSAEQWFQVPSVAYRVNIGKLQLAKIKAPTVPHASDAIKNEGFMTIMC